MKFPNIPFDGECDWTVNMTDCNRTSTHLLIVYISSVISIFVSSFAFYTIYIRQKAQWQSARLAGVSLSNFLSNCYRTSARPVDAMLLFFGIFLLLRPAHILLCAFDVYSTLAIRELSVNISYFFGYWALLVFSIGVTETVLSVLRGRARRQDDHYIWVPSSISMRILFLSLAFISPITVSILGYTAGTYGDQGDWSQFDYYQRFAWLWWSATLMLLCLLAIYFSIALMIMLREHTRRLRLEYSNNAAKASQSANPHRTHSTNDATSPPSSRGKREATIKEVLKPIRRLQHTMTLNAALVLSASIIAGSWALLDDIIIRNRVLSLIAELIVQLLWWNLFLFAIIFKISQSSRRANIQSNLSIHSMESMSRVHSNVVPDQDCLFTHTDPCEEPTTPHPRSNDNYYTIDFISPTQQRLQQASNRNPVGHGGCPSSMTNTGNQPTVTPVRGGTAYPFNTAHDGSPTRRSSMLSSRETLIITPPFSLKKIAD
jgi:hypothetical protein